MEVDCPRCHSDLINVGVIGMRCDECAVTYSHAFLASRFYRPSEYIHAERVGLEREGWDSPLDAA